MKRIKKVAAGTLLTLGSFFLLLAVYQPFVPETKPDERLSNTLGCLVFALPLTGAGGWIAWRLHQQAQKKKSDRLQSIFYGLLKKGDGKVTTLQFAMEAQLPGTEAKEYLDKQAQAFHANFEVNEEGEIFYYFNIGKFDPYRLEPSSTASLLPKKKKRKRKQ